MCMQLAFLGPASFQSTRYQGFMFRVARLLCCCEFFLSASWKKMRMNERRREKSKKLTRQRAFYAMHRWLFCTQMTSEFLLKAIKIHAGEFQLGHTRVKSTHSSISKFYPYNPRKYTCAKCKHVHKYISHCFVMVVLVVLITFDVIMYCT